ncbi:unnamed protein product [Porites evermanni]|uniref:Uncharacterized protein n=1 Tax=Porites evermanni TaxID=104178 RepID=A0ABN8MM14_9CNID|nr:unnamed protein product [Porites evermanni]
MYTVSSEQFTIHINISLSECCWDYDAITPVNNSIVKGQFILNVPIRSNNLATFWTYRSFQLSPHQIIVVYILTFKPVQAVLYLLTFRAKPILNQNTFSFIRNIHKTSFEDPILPAGIELGSLEVHDITSKEIELGPQLRLLLPTCLTRGFAGFWREDLRQYV